MFVSSSITVFVFRPITRELLPLFLRLSLLLSGRGLHGRRRRLVQRVQPVEDHDVPLVPAQILAGSNLDLK